MDNRIIDASSVVLNKEDQVMFDCNVLMYLFYTYGTYSQETIRKYTNVFNTAISKGCRMYIPSIEISEFINTYCRAEYKRYLRREKKTAQQFDYKYAYRATKDYEDTVKEIKSIINRQILSIFIKLDDEFSSIDISSIYYNVSEFDFNDRYYIKLAQKYDLKIITNDADFSGATENIEIITANRHLLLMK